ncbi:TIGR02302 family protein [Consotaella salsifontis]|uniref:TIGR02302 family protein n=1 Tax=Consotaella salsifontis TaxID=1365950 RepID=A0A1T4RR93_9HYPH|nr:TIGR02302 family protein [Consotaella salsifontis]SKA18545.1 TIGR02302 family protein [Consotaella salsifontis]
MDKDAHPRRNSADARFLDRRLAPTRASAWVSILVERLWPTLLALSSVVALFLILAWFGVFFLVPAGVRFAILAALALAFGVALWRARVIALPGRREVDERIEVESRLAHQPLSTQSDRLVAEEEGDPFAAALWREHRRRMAARLADLSGGAPRTRTERLDPYGIRAVLACLLVTAFAFSHGSHGGRIWDAFLPPPASVSTAARVDAWITPPAYTSRAPIFLTDPQRQAALGPIEVPEGSVLSVRVSDATGASLGFKPDGGAEQQIPTSAPDASGDTARSRPAESGERSVPGEYEFVVKSSGTARLATASGNGGQWTFTVIDDAPPTVAFKDDPKPAANGALQLAYVVSDDYGVSRGKAAVRVEGEGAAGARPLYPAPEIRLALPRRTKGEAEAHMSVDLTDSPYAGADVAMTLEVEDDAGQVGRSAEIRLKLPEKRFFNPLARAVVEQRRMLALNGDAAPKVVDMLDAVTSRPEFIERSADYLALRAARERIAHAADDDVLRSAVDFLWEIALGIEAGDLAIAERKLNDVRERLSEALQNGASQEEIDKLMKELRQAMNEYLQALAEAMRDMPAMTQDQLQMGNVQEIRPQDLDRMLDQIEDLAKSGSRDAAEQLLSELQQMMNNLQAMRPGQMQQGRQQSQMQQEMNKLGDMLRRQQQLMDQTFDLSRRLNNQQQSGDEYGEGGEPQEQPGSGGDQSMTTEQLQKLMKELQARQGQLQKDLEAFQKRMKELGMDPAQSLGEAGKAMGNAEGALGQGDDGTALGEQGRALEAMRRGGRQMMEQMQQAMQPGQGQSGRQGQGMARGPQDPMGRDPLGRPRSTEGPVYDGDVKVPDEIDVQRARRILDAIRERLGRALSPQLEREYLERLLQPQ